jgi:hypothetical protein
MRPPVVPTFLPPPPRRSATGLAVSVVVHVCLILAVLSPWLRRYHILNPLGAGSLVGTGGGGGGSGEQYIALPALRPPAPAAPQVETPVAPPVVPPPTETPTEIPPPLPEADSIPAAPPAATQPGAGSGGTGPGSGGGSGGGNGGGTGPGTGTGSGPGAGGAARGRPPEPRVQTAFPLDGIPRSLRGKSHTVRFYVSAAGVLDRFEVIPALPAGRYREQFEESLRQYRFRAARDSLNRAVPGIHEIQVDFPNN